MKNAVSNFEQKLWFKITVVCILLCFICLVLSGEAVADAVDSVAQAFSADATVVYDEVYGPVANNYAAEEKKVEFKDGEDTQLSIICSDGTTKFSSSSALQKSSSDPVWSDYYIEGDLEGITYCINNDLLIRVKDKQSNLWGAIDKDGNFKIPCNYCTIGKGYNYTVALKKVNGSYIGDIYNKPSSELMTSFKFDYSGSASYIYINWYYEYYFSIHFSSSSGVDTFYYSFKNDHVIKRDDIRIMDSTGPILKNNTAFISNNKLYIESKETSPKEILSFPEGTDYSQLDCTNSYIYIRCKTPEQQYERSHYITFNGNEIFGINGNSPLFDLYDGKIIGNDESVKITKCYDQHGNLIKTLDGITREFNMSNFKGLVNWVIEGNLCKIKVYDETLTFVKFQKQIDLSKLQDVNSDKFVDDNIQKNRSVYDIVYGSEADEYWNKDNNRAAGHIMNLDNINAWCFSRSLETKSFNGAYIEVSYVEQTTWKEKNIYIDINFNEVSDFPDNTMKDGTNVYGPNLQREWTQHVFIDENGNPIVRNNYTLSTYFSTNYGCRNGYGEVQHALDDIWWAQDKNGKYGAIDTYGNVVVDFVYDKQYDLCTNMSKYALGYRNNKWEFIDVTQGPTPIKPKPKVDKTTGTSISVSWPEISGATKYAVYYKDAGGMHTVTEKLTDNFVKIANLRDASNYKILVQAYVNGKWSDFTDEDWIEATTKTVRPVLTARTSSMDYAIDLSWNKIQDATEYGIYEIIDGRASCIKNVSSDTNKFTVENLTPGVYHTFLVQSKVDGEWSPYDSSDYRRAIPKGGQDKPVITDTIVTGTNINIIWEPATGATKYAVATRQKGTTNWVTHTLNCVFTNYVVTDLNENTTYQCLVQGFVNGKWTPFVDSDIVEATTDGICPNVTAEPGINDGEINLSWPSVPNASFYNVYEYKNGFIELSAKQTKNWYTAKNLSAGKTHTFLVQAFVDGRWSSSDSSHFRSAVPFGDEKPNISKAEGKVNSIHLEWGYVPGASRYAIATREKGTGAWFTYSSGCTDTQIDVKNLKDNTTYECLVQARIDGSWTLFDYRDYKTATTLNIAPYVVAKPGKSDGEIVLTWDKIEGATNYIAYEVKGSSFLQIGEELGSDKTSITASNLSAGKEHVFLVQAKVDGHWSKFNSTNYAKGIPAGSTKPTIASAVSSTNSMMLSWDNVPGATKYAIAYKYANTSSWNTVSLSCTDLKYTINNLEDCTNYDFLVQAYVDGFWTFFDNLDIVSARTLGETKPIVKATFDNKAGTISLSWNKVSNATNYLVYEVNGSSFSQIGGMLDVGTTSIKVSNVKSGVDHLFLVQAKINGIWSKFNPGNYVKVTSKPVISSATVSGTNVAVSWEAVFGASKYAIAYREKGTSNWITPKNDCTDIKYTINGLVEGKTYEILVQANINGKWTSFNSGDYVVVKL